MLPIILVVSFFQLLILKQPFPNLSEVLFGLVFVIIGLMLFIEGLELGLFPIGDNLSYALVKKGSLFWLLLFAFALGFSTTIAEPSLIAIAKEAGKIAVDAKLISENFKATYVLGLRLSVALSVGLAILL